jgi:putative membrane protein
MSEPRLPGGGAWRTPLHQIGEPPDYRFTLANERTFLAWIRTSLALIASGVAVIQLVPGPGLIRHALGILLIALGGVLSAVSYGHWEQNERAMRLGEQLPHSLVPRLVAATLSLAAVAALVLIAVNLAT